MFELAVPVKPIEIPTLYAYEEARQAMYNVGLHWQEVGAAQLGNMHRLSHLVTTTITRRVGEGLSGFIIETPESVDPEEEPDPLANHFEIIPFEELKLFFPNDSSAYSLKSQCATVQNFASAGTWYLLAEQRFNNARVSAHDAQAFYNVAITHWNGSNAERNIMKKGAEAALLGLINGTVAYSAEPKESLDTFSNDAVSKEPIKKQYFVNKVTIDWGKSIEHCLKTWR